MHQILVLVLLRRIQMEYRIEAKLERHFELGRRMSATSLTSEVVEVNTHQRGMLLMYAGLGFAELDSGKQATLVWRASKEFENYRSIVQNEICKLTTKFDPRTVRVAKSLEIVMNKCIDLSCQGDVPIDKDALMLTWAGRRLIRIWTEDVENPHWILAKESLRMEAWQRVSEGGRFQKWIREQVQRPKLCQDLRQHASCWRRLAEAELGMKLKRDKVGDFTFLPGLEAVGDAVAYVASSGRLAWRASPKYLSELDETEVPSFTPA